MRDVENSWQSRTEETYADEGGENSPWKDELLSTVDSKQASAQQQEVSPEKTLADIVRANESAIDADRDGKITQTELNRAVSNSKLDTDASAVVVALTKNYQALSELSYENILWSSSLTLADLDRYASLAMSCETKTKEQQQLTESVDFALKETYAQSERAGQKLFGPDDQISPKAVSQGGIGDCAYLAILAGMASTDHGRQMIRDMIRPEGDGYVVTFADGQSVSVEKPTPAELTLYAHSNGNGTWVAVLEKAYGKLLAEKHNGDVLAPHLSANECEKYIPQKTLTEGKRQHVAINPSIFEIEKLHDQLTLMSRDSMVMTAGTGPNPDEMAKQNRQPKAEKVDEEGNLIPGSDSVNISGFHVYSIERYDVDARTVYLRNPHDGTQLLRISLDTFRQSFVGFNSVLKD